ncbi:MAG: exodeoxyribonuclease VII large subunit [Elainellaceae cyanobacterium]
MNENLHHIFAPSTPLSVMGLTIHIQDLLEQDDQLRQVWVMGEVSSASRYRSGIFFTLQDPDADAAMSCVVWRNQIEQLAIQPEPGEQLIILGRVRLHRKRGTYQLNVWQALPAGEGLRAIRYRQLKQRLETAGLFDLSRKRVLPPHPQTIAVVTSPQAAAWGDIKRTLKRRYPGLKVLFSPALVQGDQAPAFIVKAIRRVVADGRAEVVLLSRGGGATEDMDCFNHEAVVEAIANCPIPVVAGIGHQRDESLSDLAADVFAHTPTAAAEQAVPQLSDLAHAHNDRRSRLLAALQSHLRIHEESLLRLREGLQRLHLDQTIYYEKQEISWLRQKLIQGMSQRLHSASQQHQLLGQKLSTLNPENVLKRGYAVMKQMDGDIVRSPSELTVGQQAWVSFYSGNVRVKVDAIEASHKKMP